MGAPPITYVPGVPQASAPSQTVIPSGTLPVTIAPAMALGPEQTMIAAGPLVSTVPNQPAHPGIDVAELMRQNAEKDTLLHEMWEQMQSQQQQQQ